mmetsp:Transcript_16458/g.40533  ORF Transcript_16458/g.40533 Transcript_16458/m.40533 type:complete len:367 (+) Transcript_16458:122-1222(+)
MREARPPRGLRSSLAGSRSLLVALVAVLCLGIFVLVEYGAFESVIIPLRSEKYAIPHKVPRGEEAESPDYNDILAFPEMYRRVEAAMKFSDGVCWRNTKKFTETIWPERGLLNVSSYLNIDGDNYQFGVFKGSSLRWLQASMPRSYFWGFDSFEGLPPEASNVTMPADWTPGAFAFKDLMGLLNRHGGPSRVHFFKGFYNDTLKNPEDMGQEAGRVMKPAFYVDIDADLYISTYQALDWMFKNKLVRVGTIIGYDDWWVLPCAMRSKVKDDSRLNPLFLDGGEARAHREITEQYNVKFRCICGTCSRRDNNVFRDWRPYYVIENIGEGVTPETGFELNSKDDLAWFMDSSHPCVATTKHAILATAP